MIRLSKNLKRDRSQRGMTLIELIIYSALLSILISSFLYFSMTIHIHNSLLIHEIQDAYSS